MSKFVEFCSALSVIDIAHMIGDLDTLDKEGALPQKCVFKNRVAACAEHCNLSTGDAWASLRAYVLGYGATKWASTMLKRDSVNVFMEFGCTAFFHPQMDLNKAIYPAGEPVEFDITRALLKLTADEIHDLEDDQDTTDTFADLDALNHSGPYRVECTDSIMAFFDVEELGDVTEEMIAKKREELL